MGKWIAMKTMNWKTMNKRLLIGAVLACCLLAPNLGRAQDGESREKIKSLKIAFFTERLSLSTEEASAFWPIYNTYEKDKEDLLSTQRKEVFSRIPEVGSMSEQEARRILNRHLEIEELEEELDKEFNLKIAETFSAKHALLLQQAEHEFRKRLLREYRKRHGNQP